jgi:hypothetical protein
MDNVQKVKNRNFPCSMNAHFTRCENILELCHKILNTFSFNVQLQSNR